MKKLLAAILTTILAGLFSGQLPAEPSAPATSPSPEQILGNPQYLAASFGGYRHKTRDQVPTVEELKEDVKIMHAAGIRIVRTYNTQHYGQSANLLEAIHQLKQADPKLEMYVMLGAWIECKDAWLDGIDHTVGNEEGNREEIDAAVDLANRYPDIVKVIAVGNESMVHWASSYFVEPGIVLKWVNYLQDLKKKGEIPADIWITSSDNFASWGGDGDEYHKPDLVALIKAVDYVSMHTYPFHDTHYNSDFWMTPEDEKSLPAIEQVDAAMARAIDYAKSQYAATAAYVHSIAPGKPIHIGETGWGTTDAHLYGPKGSHAADEYKQKLYYDHLREWTNAEGISCFYFEFFDEQWKDAGNAAGSENHFGLINLRGQAKYALWHLVDEGAFAGLTRGGHPITKTHGGSEEILLKQVLAPPSPDDSDVPVIGSVNNNRQPGEPVTESQYIVYHQSLTADPATGSTYPSARLRINAWEGTCEIKKTEEHTIEVTPGSGDWWGCALELSGGAGEDLSAFADGALHFEIKGNPGLSFNLGFQTGNYGAGTQVNNFVRFQPEGEYALTNEWKAYTLPIAELNDGANLKDITSAIAFMGEKENSHGTFAVRNITYSREP
ncbi:exo-beta-1,3-glucanase [bacterium]|nr:exo-beta-1,3-glucanase [bacterium]